METNQDKTAMSLLEAVLVGADDSVGSVMDKLESSGMSHMGFYIRNKNNELLGCALFIQEPDLAGRVFQDISQWEDEQKYQYINEEEE